jgi:hypothetical protein
MAETDILSCPSCGRAIPADSPACRFCAAVVRRRMPVAILTFGACALLGIALIHFGAAMTHKPAYVKIADLSPEMNFERVRVVGRVAGISVIRGRYESRLVKMDLEDVDATNALFRPTVSARLEGEAGSDYAALKDPPRRGDTVEVAGSLYAGGTYRQISVGSVQVLKIRERGTGGAGPAAAARPVATDLRTSVGELLASPEKFRNRWVEIGTAVVVSASSEIPLLKVSDPGRPEPVLVVFGFRGGSLAAGREVSVRGQFVFYDKQGYWEIKTRRDDATAVTEIGR